MERKKDITENINYADLLKNQIRDKQCAWNLDIMIKNSLTFTDHIMEVWNKSNQIF